MVGDVVEAVAAPDDLISVEQATRRFAGLFPSVDHPQDHVLELLWQGVVVGELIVFAFGPPHDGWTRFETSGQWQTFVDAQGAAVPARMVAYSLDELLSYFLISDLPSRLPQDDEGRRRELQRLPLEAVGEQAVQTFRSACFVSVVATEVWLRRQTVQPLDASPMSSPDQLTQKTGRPRRRHPVRGVIEEEWQRIVKHRQDPWSTLNVAETRRLCLENVKKIIDEGVRNGNAAPRDEAVRQWRTEFEQKSYASSRRP